MEIALLGNSHEFQKDPDIETAIAAVGFKRIAFDLVPASWKKISRLHIAIAGLPQRARNSFPPALEKTQF